MSYLLTSLASKPEVDQAICGNSDKVVVLRFGRATDAVCMQQDDILAKSERVLSKMGVFFVVDVDAVPEYIRFFDITLIPSTVFFFNRQHIKVDFGAQDNTKFVGAFHCQQDLIDLVEVVYRGASRGKFIVDSPIPRERIPRYDLIYKDI